jgi:hypothetical protein
MAGRTINQMISDTLTRNEALELEVVRLRAKNVEQLMIIVALNDRCALLEKQLEAHLW